jgi:hypothetical protein
MITGILRWARARKRYKAGTTFDIGYSRAVVQTGITFLCRLLRLSTLLISLFFSQSGAIFMAVSYELPEQCEHVTRFPVVCIHLTRTPVSKRITTSFSMGARSLFLSFLL